MLRTYSPQDKNKMLKRVLRQRNSTPWCRRNLSWDAVRRRIKVDSSNAAKEKVECVVIGAGVVGLAVARELSKRGKQVLVVDSAATFGTATSSRSSEVIHAGIYYPPNSLKAVHCIRGRKLLYDYCNEHAIPHKQIGKLIVATVASDVPKLNDLLKRGIENGVGDLRMLDASEAMVMEPELHCVKAIFSPSSGIVDSHSLMLSLVGEAEANGTTFSYNTTVIGGDLEGNEMSLYVLDTKFLESWDQTSPLHPELILIPKIVVNSAGLSAPILARQCSFLSDSVIPPAHYARGSYFTLSNTGETPFRHLIYPIPEEGGLGVHVTLDLDRRVKFGPDVEWIDGLDEISCFRNRFDYTVSTSSAERFYKEIKRYYPYLKDGSLQPGYAGIRPKLSGPGQPPVDFIIQGEDVHGVSGLVNLFGMESPGLTASLSIAEHVATRLIK